MEALFRPGSSRIHRNDDSKRSAYAFVPYETHFGELCGFADDVVEAGRGFGMYPHRDMEITTILMAGAQRHEDSTGGRHLLGTNAVQTMSAGTGIRHSEFNASNTEPFHSYQLWVYPRRAGVAPRYETFAYEAEDKRDRFLLALSPDRRGGSAMIGQDAFLSVASLSPGFSRRYAMHGPGAGVYIHCAAGSVIVGGQRLGPGDAVGIWKTEGCDVAAFAQSELVLVEVPMARGVAS